MAGHRRRNGGTAVTPTRLKKSRTPSTRRTEATGGDLEVIRAAYERWTQTTLREALERQPERQAEFTTLSSQPVRRLYTPLDVAGIDYLRDIGFPGEFPFTRGIHATMYRGRLWTFRLFSGFGTPEDTNRRYKFLISQGQTGLSVAFDLPTLYGRDPDHPLSLGEVGKCGVSIVTLRDMEILFDGIDLASITTSMTINSPAAVLICMYAAVALKRGIPLDRIGGTTQNDILKEYIAQKEYIYPPRPSMRLVVDSIAWCARHMPKWNPISISGYHIREAGSTAVQELAFTLYDGIEYVRHCIEAGLDVDEFAPRLSFFFNCHNDFFEEIAKFRAARRIWAHVMRDRFHARNPRSWWLRFHTQTAGCSLTWQQPYNNIIRTTIQALAAVLGGTQSLHTNAFDEAYALPTEFSAMLALRTQQIIAFESGVANTVDPLGGSYFVEALTKQMEDQAYEYFDKLDAMGGMIPAIERGYPQREIAEAAYRYQRQVESKEKIIVGVNDYVIEEDRPIEILYIDEKVAEQQIARMNEVKRTRDNRAVVASLQALRRAAQGSDNLMPYILEAVQNYATIGEICDTLRDVWGEWEEPEVI
jgi:methylmalonyl-CoA mutase N-terminal domain/subunit